MGKSGITRLLSLATLQKEEQSGRRYAVDQVGDGTMLSVSGSLEEPHTGPEIRALFFRLIFHSSVWKTAVNYISRCQIDQAF